MPRRRSCWSRLVVVNALWLVLVTWMSPSDASRPGCRTHSPPSGSNGDPVPGEWWSTQATSSPRTRAASIRCWVRVTMSGREMSAHEGCRRNESWTSITNHDECGVHAVKALVRPGLIARDSQATHRNDQDTALFPPLDGACPAVPISPRGTTRTRFPSGWATTKLRPETPSLGLRPRTRSEGRSRAASLDQCARSVHASFEPRSINCSMMNSDELRRVAYM